MQIVRHEGISLIFIVSIFIIGIYLLAKNLITAEIGLIMSFTTIFVLAFIWKYDEIKIWIRAHQVNQKPTTQVDVARFLLQDHGSMTKPIKETGKTLALPPE